MAMTASIVGIRSDGKGGCYSEGFYKLPYEEL